MEIDHYEGGTPDSELLPLIDNEAAAAQSAAAPAPLIAPAPSFLAVPTATYPPPPTAPMAVAQLPVLTPSNGPSQQPPPLADTTNFLRIKLSLLRIASAIGRVIRGEGFRFSIPVAHFPTIEEREESGGSADNEQEASVNREDDEKRGWRTFCATHCRDTIINMAKWHAAPILRSQDASPQILNRSRNGRLSACTISARGTGTRSVGLPLGNAGRWELRARCAHKLISRLNPTMILENH